MITPRDRRDKKDDGPPSARRITRRTTRSLAAVLVAGLAWGALPASPVFAAGGDPTAAPVAATDWVGNLPNSTGGTDYFINSTTGNDANAGTSADAPWFSLAKASATTFAPGDRILLAAGSEWHGQQLHPKGSGAEGAPIYIGAYGEPAAGLPYIATDGAVPSPFRADGTKNPVTVGLTGAIVLQNQEYFEISNVELSNDDDFATNITAGSYVRDGIAVSINADLMADGADTIMNHFRISDIYVHNIDGPSSWQKIHYGAVNFQVFGEKGYEEYAEGGYYFQDVRIEDNTFINVELHAVQLAFNWFEAADSASGQFDEAGKWHEGWEQLWVRTRDLYTRDVYIGHNYAESVGQGAIQLANAKDMLVEYNEVNGFLERYDAVSCALYLWAGADTVMQYNEVYGGPDNEYDGTPWDLEFTNFDVTYQYNYSHDNAAGWMAYMGNSSNSVARYNLSVNDNGVLVKNMLSTNYSPTYFVNNTFVYDGEDLDYFHDETFLSTVYFLNNVFYNTSETTTTPWSRRTDALRQAVFSNNAYFEASGNHSAGQPVDAAAIEADPQFVTDPTAPRENAGVENIVSSAAAFALEDTSPLIDAGRYNPHLGEADFLGTDLYFGDAPDIGIAESRLGAQVVNPVDTNPIEEEVGDTRVNLALGKPVTASTTHPHQNGALHAGLLTDGDTTTRWAAADSATYPITLDIDLGAETTFDEVYLDEFTDAGTLPRVQTFELQRWDAESESWVVFYEGTDGIRHDLTVADFGSVTTSKVRVALTSKIASEVYAPSMTEISLFAAPVPSDADPQITQTVGLFDLNTVMADEPNNTVSFDADLDGDELSLIRYIGTEGNVLGSLDDTDYTVTESNGVSTYALSAAFLSDLDPGTSGLSFEFASGTVLRVALEVVDSTVLAAAVAEARAVTPRETDEYTALVAATDSAEATLAKVNRAASGTGNSSVNGPEVDAAAASLRAALDAFAADPGTEPVTPGVPAPDETADPEVPGGGGVPDGELPDNTDTPGTPDDPAEQPGVPDDSTENPETPDPSSPALPDETDVGDEFDESSPGDSAAGGSSSPAGSIGSSATDPTAVINPDGSLASTGVTGISTWLWSGLALLLLGATLTVTRVRRQREQG